MSLKNKLFRNISYDCQFLRRGIILPPGSVSIILGYGRRNAGEICDNAQQSYSIENHVFRGINLKKS